VLIDSWYLSKRLWKAVKKRHWDLTGGLKSNRRIRLEDSQGIVTWPTVSEYVTSTNTWTACASAYKGCKTDMYP
jgi:hypothetical protein